jgi:hypothetical protein
MHQYQNNVAFCAKIIRMLEKNGRNYAMKYHLYIFSIQTGKCHLDSMSIHIWSTFLKQDIWLKDNQNIQVVKLQPISPNSSVAIFFLPYIYTKYKI